MGKTLKRIVAVLILIAISISAEGKGQAKYVFLFIADGMGINPVYGTELYNHYAYGAPTHNLSFTGFPVQTYVTTDSASHIVTDSCAAGTALATGYKTTNGYAGVTSDQTPVKNLCEMAKEKGMKVGIVTNVPINHATPCAFYGHDRSRSHYDILSTQLINSQIDFAAGYKFLIRKKLEQTSKDWENRATEEGIKVCYNYLEAASVVNQRVILLDDYGSQEGMSYDIDREEGKQTLRNYTEAAIKYLEREGSKNGFFVMIEGGNIDHAAHDNDAATLFREINELSDCIQQAVDFMERHPKETLIVVTSDHDTGGMTMGRSRLGTNPQYLRYQKVSEEALSNQLKKMRREAKKPITWEEMKKVLEEQLGLWSKVPVSEANTAYLKEYFDRNYSVGGESIENLYSRNERLAAEAVYVLNNEAIISWGTRSHTACQVPLYVKGIGQENFYSCRDNIDIPASITKAMGMKRK